MADTISPAQRSDLMSRIRSTNTKPEIAVRSLVHRLGYRFRLHRRELPGRPDIVLPRHRKIILVHGCFWHGHDCKLASKPKSNGEYWSAKIVSNKTRDAKNLAALSAENWRVLEIWECEVRRNEGLEDKVKNFLSQDSID